MNGDDKPKRKEEGLTNAIKSLQHLLDDVGVIKEKAGSQAATFDETGEFELTGAIEALEENDEQLAVIDSHFDMSIPPALPEDEQDQEAVIPTLSESIVEGEIPVLMEAVTVPGAEPIEPPEDSNQPVKDIDPTIIDATEAACDAVQIILRRYRHQPLSDASRKELERLVHQFLEQHKKVPPENDSDV